MQVSCILWDRGSRLYPNANPQENKAQAIERDYSLVHSKTKKMGKVHTIWSPRYQITILGNNRQGSILYILPTQT